MDKSRPGANLFNASQFKTAKKPRNVLVDKLMFAGDIAFTECLRGVMVKAMDCRIVVSKFELQLCYYINFHTNNMGKGMNPLILPARG